MHCSVDDLFELYIALLNAGATHGALAVGSRALTSLRLEKDYGSWPREYTPENWPQEVGLDALRQMDKPFLNRALAEAVMQQAPREHLVLLEIDPDAAMTSNADASGGKPIFLQGNRLAESAPALMVIPLASRWQWALSKTYQQARVWTSSYWGGLTPP